MKLLLALIFIMPVFAHAQNVGIGTTNPLSRLHVTDSNVIFSAGPLLAEPLNFLLPINGPGTRLMWMPLKGAFRAGGVDNNSWDADSIGTFSAAMGANTRAIGSGTFAMGTGTKAYGNDAVAMGNGTTALGNYSTALGINTKASGERTIALGSNAIAAGLRSVAIGESSISNGSYSISLGFGNVAKAYASIAIGLFSDSGTLGNGISSVNTDPLFYIGNGTNAVNRHNTMVVYKNGTIVSKNPTTLLNSNNPYDIPVTGTGTRLVWIPERSAFRVGTVTGSQWDNLGPWSFAAGYDTRANGNNTTAFGLATEATGVGAFAMGESTGAFGNISTSMGQGTIANAFGSVALGRYNDFINTSSQNAWVATDPLLILGNGSSSVSRANALIVYKNGNTSINGSTDINYQSGISSAQLNLIENNGAEFTHLAFFNKAGVNNLTDKWLIRAYPLGANAARRFNFYTNGGANGGDILTLFGNGNATLAGVLTQLSDARLKKNIVPLQNALQKVSNINAYHYHWKEDGRDASLQLGILAQEVQEVFPELVIKDEKGNLSVNYSGLIPVLLASIKEQQAQIQKQQIQIQVLQKQQEEILKLIKK